MKRLLLRGNPVALAGAAALRAVANGQEITDQELHRFAAELETWSRDVRAVASEEMP